MPLASSLHRISPFSIFSRISFTFSFVLFGPFRELAGQTIILFFLLIDLIDSVIFFRALSRILI